MSLIEPAAALGFPARDHRTAPAQDRPHVIGGRLSSGSSERWSGRVAAMCSTPEPKAVQHRPSYLCHDAPMTLIEVVLGDITKEHADAIVTAANESLLGGGGRGRRHPSSSRPPPGPSGRRDRTL